MSEWRDIPGYEGLYQASDDGQIRTCEGKVTSNARYEKRVWKQRVLKPKYRRRRGKTGNIVGRGSDARVDLWKDGVNKTHLVSRLVAMTWCSGYSEGLTVNHIDGNPENNRRENLEWITQAENTKHGFENGLFSTSTVTTITMSDGTIKQFRSMAEASRYLGKSNGWISGVSKKMAKCDAHYDPL
jgi:hypothetical protein